MEEIIQASIVPESKNYHFKLEGTTMPLSKKKSTTSNADPFTSEQAPQVLPAQQTFHEHLRALTRDAVRVVIEEVMREELKQFLGASWGESTPERKGYRNGIYTRDLATTSGPLEDLEVPRDRAGEFHTQVFDRYQRYEPQVAEGRDGDVRSRGQYPKSGRSHSDPHGGRSQRQQRESSQRHVN